MGQQDLSNLFKPMKLGDGRYMGYLLNPKLMNKPGYVKICINGLPIIKSQKCIISIRIGNENNKEEFLVYYKLKEGDYFHQIWDLDGKDYHIWGQFKGNDIIQMSMQEYKQLRKLPEEGLVLKPI